MDMDMDMDMEFVVVAMPLAMAVARMSVYPFRLSTQTLFSWDIASTHAF